MNDQVDGQLVVLVVPAGVAVAVVGLLTWWLRSRARAGSVTREDERSPPRGDKMDEP